MSKTASKDKRIADIVELIEQGKETKDILRIIAANSGKPQRTIESDIKAAKEIVFKRNEGKEAIRQANLSKEYSEAVKGQIISDIEIEAVLCKIITGGMQVEAFIQGEPILRDITPMEIIQAAKAVYLRRGSNAPIKQSNVNPDGTALNPLELLIQKGGKITVKSGK